MGISKLATSFLDNYGLTKEATEDTAQKFVLVDSGFYGSIGEAVDMTVKSLYSVSMLEAGRLAVKLVCASDDAIGEQILPVTASEWPRLKWYGTHRIPAWLEANAFGLALGMQLMPRYHGRYCDLELVDGKVVALPRAEPLWLDLDTTVGSMNDSVVNPFAAAIMQYRVVKAALERYAEMHGTERVITPEPEAPRTPIVASPAKSDAVSGVLYLGA